MRDLLDILDRQLLEDEAKSSFSKNDLLDLLKKMGYEDNSVKGNHIKVLVELPKKKQTEFRKDVLANILSQLQQTVPEQDPQYSEAGGSSVGAIVFGNNKFVIYVKDKERQGDKSAGVANEIELGSIIQSVIDKYGSANVTFIDPRGKKLTINDATDVDVSGRQASGRKKADVVIKSPTSRLPVSIKKVNAEQWESADNLFGQKARAIIQKLIDEGVVTLNKLEKLSQKVGEPVYELSKEIVIEPTEEEALKAIFGSDINPEGGIVIQTFKPEHFKQDENNINVDAHAVITSKEDIPESHVMYWILRNNKDRNVKSLGIRGIRPVGVTATRAFGTTGTKNIVFTDPEGNVIKPSDFTKDVKSIGDIKKQGTAPLDDISKSLTEPRVKRDNTPTPEPKSDTGPAGRALR